MLGGGDVLVVVRWTDCCVVTVVVAAADDDDAVDADELSFLLLLDEGIAVAEALASGATDATVVDVGVVAAVVVMPPLLLLLILPLFSLAVFVVASDSLITARGRLVV